MAFKKTELEGPMWTAKSTGDLTAAQHRTLDIVLRMCCQLYNAILEAWKYQWKWYRRDHSCDDTTQSDIYDPGRIVGDLGTLYAQLQEFRNNEQEPAEGMLLWRDIAIQIGRGCHRPLRRRPAIILRPMQSPQQRREYQEDRIPAIQDTPDVIGQWRYPLHSRRPCCRPMMTASTGGCGSKDSG